MARTISGKTTTLALIGDPVGHSLSPQMHNYACELLGLDYVYVAYTVREDGVPAAFDAMRALGIRGFNVTMPCKIAAFENVDKRSEAAAIIGACNTVINDGGVLTGHITDRGRGQKSDRLRRGRRGNGDRCPVRPGRRAGCFHL